MEYSANVGRKTTRRLLLSIDASVVYGFPRVQSPRVLLEAFVVVGGGALLSSGFRGRYVA